MEDDLELVLPGAPQPPAPSADPYADEVASAKKVILRQRPDPRSYGQMASDTLENLKDAGRSILPTALGGKGDFGSVSGIYNAVTGAYDAGTKMLSGEIPLFDETGYPTNEATAGATNIAGLLAMDGRGVGSNGAAPTFANRAGDSRIRAAIQADARQGKIRGMAPGIGPGGSPKYLPGMSPGQIDAAAAEGIPVTAYDLSGGPNMKRLVEKSASDAHNTDPVVGLQQGMAERSSSGRDYLANTVDNIAGRPLSTGAEFQAAVDNIAAHNGPEYPRVMALPGNQSLFSPRLKSILETRPTIAKVMADLDESIRDTGEMPPAIYDRRGNLNIQPGNAPSLEYLNTVYKRVREAANKAYRAGDGDAGSKLKSAADDLRSELDALAEKNPDGTSSYQTVRDTASELFGAQNALEAGYNFLNAAGPMKMTELQANMRRFSPPQQEQFRTGLLSRIKDDILNPGKTNSISAYLDGSNPAMFDRIASVIGHDNATRLGNQVRLQRILNAGKAPDLAAVPPSKGGHSIGPMGAATIGAATVVGTEAIAELGPQVMNIVAHPGKAAAIAGMGAGVIYGLKKMISGARNAYEASVARSVLDAVTTHDPAAIRRLDDYPPNIVSYVLDRVGPRATRATEAIATGQKEKQEEPGSDLELVIPGGDLPVGQRVQRKAGGRIKGNKISAEVKRVRALLSQKTANILSMPDDAVATALHIAKGK